MTINLKTLRFPIEASCSVRVAYNAMDCCYIQPQLVNNQTYIADLFLRLDLLFRNLRYRRNGLFCTDYVRFKFKRGVSHGCKTLKKQEFGFS